ncbi:esterase/lipase [Cavenderia fasciculata]|uniref:Esterase/lipase n=1 Tax=Cavenderia fasciculata TaxID=261658 RepID=F4PQM7_CACFS|nr:esterase/lipase [Cavenderia fasciculata]EGG21194.1 esterase/lipase [Cavenderia fasciculata]|eukprot:XP_004359044.1 esterase/lipase [Cavenderia fasciculata]
MNKGVEGNQIQHGEEEYSYISAGGGVIITLAIVLIQYLSIIIYLMMCIFMSIATYMGCHRGPFGKHPHIIRFGFLPGLLGSELCLHLIILVGSVSLLLWKFNLFIYFIPRVGLLALYLPSSFFLLITYFSGFKTRKVAQNVLNTFCGTTSSSSSPSLSSSASSLDIKKKYEYQPSNKLSAVIHIIRSAQREAFSLVESFLLQFRKHKKKDEDHSSHVPNPNPWSISFWLKMLIPLPHPHYPNVSRIRHIPYGEEAYQKVDVYFHNTFPTNRPILVHIHGGGWREGGGKRNTCSLPLIYQMANQKWIVFSVGYRLAPNHRFPTHINDVKRAITWVRENAVHYGGDIDCMFLAGGSAGGHLATLVALTDGIEFKDFKSSIPSKPMSPDLFNFGPDGADLPSSTETTTDQQPKPLEEELEENININMNSLNMEAKTKKQYPPFRGCVSLYGVYDFTNRHNQWPFDLVTYLGMMIMRNTYDQEPHIYSMGSPYDQVKETSNTPFFFIHGDMDELVPIEESIHLMNKMKQVVNKPNITWMEVPGGHHAFDLVFSPRTIFAVHGVYRFLNKLYRQHVSDKLLERRQSKQRSKLSDNNSNNNGLHINSINNSNITTNILPTLNLNSPIVSSHFEPPIPLPIPILTKQ